MGGKSRPCLEVQLAFLCPDSLVIRHSNSAGRSALRDRLKRDRRHSYPALDPPHSAASPAVPALNGSGSPTITDD
jgi:hypothetical protein